MADRITHRLKVPISVTRGSGDQVHEEQLTELTITPITKAKHLRALDLESGEIAKGIRLIAIATGLPVQAVDEMDLADFTEISQELERFLPAGLATGKSASATLP